MWFFSGRIIVPLVNILNISYQKEKKNQKHSQQKDFIQFSRNLVFVTKHIFLLTSLNITKISQK